MHRFYVKLCLDHGLIIMTGGLWQLVAFGAADFELERLSGLRSSPTKLQKYATNKHNKFYLSKRNRNIKTNEYFIADAEKTWAENAKRTKDERILALIKVLHHHDIPSHLAVSIMKLAK